MLQTKARVWQSLRDDPLARRTFVVAKLAASAWSVFPLDEGEVLYEGPFMRAWFEATHLARAKKPALVVAVNAEGNVIVRERLT